MTLLVVLKIVVFTTGVLSFGSLSLLWFQEMRRGDRRLGEAQGGVRVGGVERPQSPELCTIHGAMAVFATVWFLGCLANAFGSAFPQSVADVIKVGMWQLSFVWPPMILHMQYRESRSFLRSPDLWRRLVVACYLAALPFPVIPVFWWAGLIEPGPWFRLLSYSFIGLFVLVALACAWIGSQKPRREETSEERRTRVWHLLLWGLVVVVMLAILVPGTGGYGDWLSLIGPSFPLMFVFVSTYYLERFTFFDVFVKRGTFAILALSLLAGYFTLTARLLSRVELGWLEPWFYALTLLPVALSLPWFYRRLEEWLDRRWLGREFSPLEALKRFLSGLQEATSEDQLVERSEKGLAEIFQTEVRVTPGASRAEAGDSVSVLAPIRRPGTVYGWLRLGRRRNKMPYFSKDIALLTTLAEVLAYFFENIRLQARKRDQEQRERELTLHASRSELKALRAQINPHFLFNALNAIAGLIHRDPARAEETVEQLAEIFRYTLRGSEAEWAKLGDEIEFARAYLEIERARFGSRLETSIEMEDSIGEVQIPTMMLQTLVENAVKHGVASVRGVGAVQVSARRIGERVRLEVRDNGPGFGNSEPSTSARKGAGYGLKNVRSRLQGYFEDQASLEIGRDEDRGLTVVAMEFPAAVVAFRRKTGS